MFRTSRSQSGTSGSGCAACSSENGEAECCGNESWKSIPPSPKRSSAACPRAGWVSKLLLESLRTHCNHPAQ